MQHQPVLLATDLTARCDRPLDRALLLASHWNCPLHIVHVIEPKDSEKKGLVPRDISSRIRAELPETGVDVRISVQMGDICDEILKVAKQEKCRLIVTGVAHYDGLRDIFLGTPVDHLLRSAPMPVLLVKRRPLRPYANILIATDFSDCSLKALNCAARLFPDSALHLVHAYRPPYSGWLKSGSGEKDAVRETGKSMERFLAQTTISNETFERLTSTTEQGELAEILRNRIAESEADLVVLGAIGKTGTLQTSVGSNARIVLGWIRQDVLVVRQ
ncbi:Nucleotide-binding universal stress protein, UspA family [Parasphingorhabdus marina DSM 22363]|uniref:Nucleotide-binding universal stress protein, UspA family n=1 Tax=Parasphingorhabdus marina DSM 22363 TaxID=1123272 RepID=A0A1N6CQD3_9SPHN|nr:universal stress protein [Parasphingorhabdus marina]SIN60763.1 Nucleotide-binding universal stress protein, UspA family [Parasphingorhabdus marina DSM 22363]